MKSNKFKKILFFAILLLLTTVFNFGCAGKFALKQDNGQFPKPFVSLPASSASISGDRVFTVNHQVYEGRLASGKIMVYNLVYQKQEMVVEVPGILSGPPEAYGDMLVWADDRNNNYIEGQELVTTNYDVFLLNLKTGELKQLTKDKNPQIHPRIWKNYVVWIDSRHDKRKEYPGDYDVYLYDLETGLEQRLTKGTVTYDSAAIHDYKIVWADNRNNRAERIIRGGSNVSENNTDIFMFDLKTNRETLVTTGPLMESKPDIWGDVVVWEDRNKDSFEADIYALNLKTGKKITVVKNRANQTSPRIYKNKIVWMDERNGGASVDVIDNGQEPNADIYMFDLETGKEERLTGKGVQVNPKISGNYLMYTKASMINPQIEVVINIR